MSELSPADVKAMAGDGFGEGGAWWLIILFLFMMGGGWNNNRGVQDMYTLNSDFASLQRQIDSATASLERKGDGIANGLCDGFYAQNTTMLNGFHGAALERANANAQILSQMNTNAMMNQQSLNGLQSAVQTGFCQTNYNAQGNTRDIIEAQNCNTRAILDALTAQRIEQKDNKIMEQQQMIAALNLAASQTAQNAYLVNALKTG